MNRKLNPADFFRSRVTPQIKITFFSTLLFGLAAHGMALFNKYSYHDDLYYMFGVGGTVSSGRWMLHIIAWLEKLFYINGHYSLPLFNGLIAIFFVALCACLIVDLLKIRRKLFCGCLGCLMVGFPVITGLFGYMFTVGWYTFALLGMMLSVWLICSGRKWRSAAAAMLAGGCAIGIYQAFIPMMLAMILIYDMMTITAGSSSGKEWRRGILRQGISLAGMLAFYWVMNRLFMIRFDQDITYTGMDDAVSLQEYLARIGRAYREFFLPMRNGTPDMFPQRLYTMYQIMLLVSLGLMGRLLFLQAKKDISGTALLFALAALFPLACEFVYVMAGHVHGLMTYGSFMLIPLLIWMLDRAELRIPALRKGLSVLASAVLLTTCGLYDRQANQCYLKMEIMQQAMTSWFTTLITQIKSSDDYRPDRPVLFVTEGGIADPTVSHIGELDWIHTMAYEHSLRDFLNSYSWREFMEVWCGFTPVYCEDEGMQYLPEVQEMPVYPEPGSIRVIRDVLVVNLRDAGRLPENGKRTGPGLTAGLIKGGTDR